MIRSVLCRGGVTVGLLAMGIGSPAVAASAIAPHAAEYVVRLEVTAPGSPYRTGTGRLSHRWADGCGTWDIDQDFSLADRKSVV